MKVSQARIKPPQLGKAQRAAKKKTPASWEKAVGGQEKNPRQLEKKGSGWPRKNPPPAGKKRQWVAKKKPPDSRWQGRCRVKVSPCACEAKKQHTTAKQNVISSAKEASASPPRGLKNTHTPEKKVLGFSQARRRPPPAHHEG